MSVVEFHFVVGVVGVGAFILGILTSRLVR